MYRIVEPQSMNMLLSDHIITPQTDLVTIKIEKSREASNKCLLYAQVLDQLENKQEAITYYRMALRQDSS